MYRLFVAKAETWPRLYREARERLLAHSARQSARSFLTPWIAKSGGAIEAATAGGMAQQD